MCVGGVVQTTVYLFLEMIGSSSGLDIYKMVAGYMQLWVLPQSRAMKLEALFSPKRHKSNKEASTFKCSASEALAIMPILAVFVQNVIMKIGQCMPHCEALLAVADLIAILQALPHGLTTPDLLRAKVRQIQEKFEECDWCMWMHSKFHWLVHLASHVERFHLLVSCWVHERKHRIIKRYSQDIQKTNKYEKHVLVQVVSHDLALLLDDDYFSQNARLKKQCKATKKVKDFFASNWCHEIQSCFICAQACLSPSGVANKKDVVILKTSHMICEVWLFAEINGECLSLVSVWEVLENHTSYTICKMQDNPALVNTSDIQCAVAYRKLHHEKAMVLLPIECR